MLIRTLLLMITLTISTALALKHSCSQLIKLGEGELVVGASHDTLAVISGDRLLYVRPDGSKEYISLSGLPPEKLLSGWLSPTGEYLLLQFPDGLWSCKLSLTFCRPMFLKARDHMSLTVREAEYISESDLLTWAELHDSTRALEVIGTLDLRGVGLTTWRSVATDDELRRAVNISLTPSKRYTLFNLSTLRSSHYIRVLMVAHSSHTTKIALFKLRENDLILEDELLISGMIAGYLLNEDNLYVLLRRGEDIPWFSIAVVKVREDLTPLRNVLIYDPLLRGASRASIIISSGLLTLLAQIEDKVELLRIDLNDGELYRSGTIQGKLKKVWEIRGKHVLELENNLCVLR